jgi:hypothetical protein
MSAPYRFVHAIGLGGIAELLLRVPPVGVRHVLVVALDVLQRARRGAGGLRAGGRCQRRGGYQRASSSRKT